MGFFTSFFSGFKTKVSQIFSFLFGEKEAAAFGTAALGLLKTELGQIAFTVVESISFEELSNAQSRKLAFKQIASAAKDGGLEYKDSIINLLIELAINSLKGHFGPK